MTSAQARPAGDKCLCCDVHGEQAPPDAAKAAARQAEAPPAAPTADLHLAAAAGEEERLRVLLAQGAPLELADSNGERALHAAASSGQGGCLRLLLAAGADIEAADAHGHTALHWAAAAGQEGCLRALLERGAQLEQRDHNGLTPLALAAGKNQLGCLYALLAAGALPTSVCRLGNSALHVAACNGSLQAVRCLAAAGVPLTARNRLGQTPRQVAVHYRQGSAERLLRQLERQQQRRGKGFAQLIERGQPLSRLAVQGAAELAAAASAADAAAAQLLEEEEREAAQQAAQQAAKAARRQRQRARQQQAAAAEQQGSRPSMEAMPAPQAIGRDSDARRLGPLASAGGATTAHTAHEPGPEQLSCSLRAVQAEDAAGSIATNYQAESHHFVAAAEALEPPAAEGIRSGVAPHSMAWSPVGCSSPATADFPAAAPATPSPALASFPPPPPCPAAGTPPPAPSPGPTFRLDEDLLSELHCPITQEPMQDPVLAADGQTYERSAIQAWIARQVAAGLLPCSPLTNLPLRHTELQANQLARKLVQALLAAGLLD